MNNDDTRNHSDIYLGSLTYKMETFLDCHMLQHGSSY